VVTTLSASEFDAPTLYEQEYCAVSIFDRRLIEEAQVASTPEDWLFLILDEIAMLDRSVVEAIVIATYLDRSHGIHVIVATQSVELLELKFSADQAQAFLASCATTVAFRCASKKPPTTSWGGLVIKKASCCSPRGRAARTPTRRQKPNNSRSAPRCLRMNCSTLRSRTPWTMR